MRNTFKIVSQAVVVLAVFALAVSPANAQMTRTLTMTCHNMANTGAQITSWSWLQADGTSIGGPGATVTPPPSWSCGGGGLFTTTLDQPSGGSSGPTAGATYTVHFFDGTPDCTQTDFDRPGQGVHFHDRCRDSANAANNAVVVIVLAN
jgi:hypothetical protein